EVVTKRVWYKLSKKSQKKLDMKIVLKKMYQEKIEVRKIFMKGLYEQSTYERLKSFKCQTKNWTARRKQPENKDIIENDNDTSESDNSKASTDLKTKTPVKAQ
ncbi:7514_t:CDS:2, partial [Gigaspora margarita]